MISGFELPERVCIDGMEYAVNTDFRAWIEIGRLFTECKGDERQNFEKMLIFAYREKLPPTAEQAMRGMLDFYRAGENGSGEAHDAPILDLYSDFPMIAAAFLREYRIDLWSEKLHWWKFRALLSCIGEENKIVKVMTYRAVDIADIADKRQKRFYAKMKKVYCLADWRSEEEKEASFIEKLNSAYEEVE